MDANARLRALYLDAYGRIRTLAPIEEGFSQPLLVRLPAAYFHQKTRLMVIGQETHGWAQAHGSDNEACVDELLDAYAKFDNGRHYLKTPFWRATYGLQARINPGEDECAVAWTNLGRVDLHRGPAPRVLVNPLLLDLFVQELAFAEPDVIVFWTGPNYDHILDMALPNVQRLAIPGQSPRELCRLNHEKLPESSFRSYHPAYLQRIGRFEAVLESIIRATFLDVKTDSATHFAK